ncbi:MAG TPA: hypothetical protein VES02_17755 [Dermatophilaceae bacterium]|nr:hypothetical protein [Dermatophilaceae bacterium]
MSGSLVAAFDTTLEPGAAIGWHRHDETDELYLLLEQLAGVHRWNPAETDCESDYQQFGGPCGRALHPSRAALPRDRLAILPLWTSRRPSK